MEAQEGIPAEDYFSDYEYRIALAREICANKDSGAEAIANKLIEYKLETIRHYEAKLWLYIGEPFRGKVATNPFYVHVEGSDKVV